MKTRVIMSPAGYQPKDLLKFIESTLDAFTMGRRNNDVVNWFIARRLIDTNENEGNIEEAFHYMLDRLSQGQKQDLQLWEENWEWKLRLLFKRYGRLTRTQLYDLWLPMEYSDGSSPDQGLLFAEQTTKG